MLLRKNQNRELVLKFAFPQLQFCQHFSMYNTFFVGYYKMLHLSYGNMIIKFCVFVFKLNYNAPQFHFNHITATCMTHLLF